MLHSRCPLGTDLDLWKRQMSMESEAGKAKIRDNNSGVITKCMVGKHWDGWDHLRKRRKVQIIKEAWTEPRGTPLFWNQVEDQKSAQDNDRAGKVEVKSGEYGTVKPREASAWKDEARKA
jgi:hypothetical protein